MLEDRNYAPIKKVTNSLIMVFCIITVLFILVVPEMMKVLFTTDYYEAVWCIPPISVGVYFIFLYSIFVNIEEFFEKTKYVVYVSVSCGIINIILNYYCIGIFGYVACAYTTMFSYILFAIGHYVFMKKIIKQKGITEEIVDGRTVLKISFIVVVASFIITFLYSYVLLRYIILFVIVAVLFLNRKKILATLADTPMRFTKR